MSRFRPAKRRVEVSVGESVRILRELQELSQNQLSGLTGIPQTTISAMENDRVRLGVERARVLARALKCHPAVLVFPGWGRGAPISGLTIARAVVMRGMGCEASTERNSMLASLIRPRRLAAQLHR